MIGMDCINQQTAQDRDCSHCIWHTDGRCASWNCEYISRKEALEALEKVKAMSTHPNTPNTLKALDCISRQDAVDIINGYAEQFNGYIGTPNDSEVYAYARGLLLSIERNISALLSAQPEIEERMSETEQNVPNDDFISRKRAIDALMEDFKRIPTNAIRAKTVIEQLPPAQPEQRWIPCTPDTMPDDLEEVYVTWVNHNPPWYYTEIKDKPFTAPAVCHRGKWYWYSSVCVDTLAEYGKNDFDEVDKDIEIVAWMPLPEPYGGD